MTVEELSLLADFAAKSKNILELGSWKGRSTRAIMDNIHPEGKITCVDTFAGNVGTDLIGMAEKEDIYGTFIRNLSPYSGTDRLKVIRCSTSEILENIDPSTKFDFIFIDADHSYEEVRKDINNCLPLLSADGIIAGHDFSKHWPGVIQAVRETFGPSGFVHNKDTTIWSAKA